MVILAIGGSLQLGLLQLKKTEKAAITPVEFLALQSKAAVVAAQHISPQTDDLPILNRSTSLHMNVRPIVDAAVVAAAVGGHAWYVSGRRTAC